MKRPTVRFRLFPLLALGTLLSWTAMPASAQTPELALVIGEADLFDADGMVVAKAAEGDMLVVLGGGDRGLITGGPPGARTIATKDIVYPMSTAGKALLEKLIAAGSKNPGHYRLRASNRRYAEDYEGMVADYTRMIELQPKETAAYLSRASAWMQLKKYDEALADLEEIVRIDPADRPKTLNGLVNVYKAKNDWQQVVAIYTEMLETGKEYGKFYESQTLTFRGAAHEQLEQWDEAKADFEKALELNPRNREATAGVERLKARE